MVPANTLPYARQERVKVGGFGCQITGCQSMKTTITGGCALGHSTSPLGGNPGGKVIRYCDVIYISVFEYKIIKILYKLLDKEI